MVTVDRRKLAAPLFAQAAAFVVVLVIGGFTGHSTTTSGPAHTATPSPIASTAAKGHGLMLTVQVVEEGTGTGLGKFSPRSGAPQVSHATRFDRGE